MKVTVKKKDSAIPVVIGTEFIKLESAMKLANILPSGGTAKLEIQDGNVLVNGEVCTMRGKKLRPGDKAEYNGKTFVVAGDWTGWNWIFSGISSMPRRNSPRGAT